jgi:hypothetical protein
VIGKDSSVTSSVKNLIDDLKENRLWPVAVGLALALVAIPLLLSKPAEQGASATTASTGTTGAAAAPGGFSLPELKPAVSVSSAAGSTERKSVRRLTRKNPFQPLVQPKAAKSGAGAPTSGGDAGAGAGSGAGSGAGTPTTTGGGSTGSTGSSGSGSSGVTYFTYVAKVNFGELGNTKTMTIQQLRSLPSSDNPIVVFMGATLDGEKAVFLVSADADLSGDGTCKPNTDQCVFLYLDKGDSETLEIAGSDGSLKTYELKLNSIDTKVLDEAPSAGASSSANAKRARAAVKAQARAARRAHRAQAGRYFNALGRIGF